VDERVIEAGPSASDELLRGGAGARLVAAFDAVSDIVTFHDAEGRLFYANRAGRNFFGIGRDEALPPLLPGDFVDAPEEQVARLIETLERDGAWRGELVVVSPRTGARIPASIVVVKQERPDGVVEYFAVSRDMSEQRASEARFRSLVQHSSDLLFVFDEDWRVEYASPSACDFVGSGPERLVGSVLPLRIHDDDVERVRAVADELARVPGASRSLEFRVVHDDGQSWLEMVATNLLTDPAVHGIVTNSRDVTERKLAEGALLASEARLRENEARYRAVVDDQTELVCRYLPDTTLTFVNRAYADFYGRRAEELVGTKLIDTYPVEVREEELARLRRFGPEHTVQLDEDWELQSDGRICWFQWTDRAFLDADGDVIEFQSVGRDVTEQRRVAQFTKRQAELLEQVARGLPLNETLAAIAHTVEEQYPALHTSILLLDDDGVTLRHGAAPSLPPTFTQALEGVRAGPDVVSCVAAVHGREPVFASDISSDPRWSELRELALAHGLAACWSTPILTSSGERVLGAFAVYAKHPGEPSTELLQLISLLTHVAAIAVERREVEDKLSHQSLHDPLTDLPNRALFLDRLSLALGRARRTGGATAVLFLDLDRFKNVNDSLGHEVGDELLVAIARRLEAVVRPGDTVARFGGDEFTVVCEDLPVDNARARSMEVADRLFHALGAPFSVDGTEMYLGASIGIALAQTGDARPEELLRDADAAMYHAKEQGRGRYEVFDDAMRARALARHATENALHRAVERGEFRLYFQPIVSIDDGRCVGAEALVRWQHPERGLVTPSEFVSLAEETGLIVGLGAWVLEQAAEQAARWQADGISDFQVSVNLSARQLAQHDLTEHLWAVLRETGLRPEHLCLEITESVLMDDADATLAAIERVHALGVKLAIDDFGTGYSSLGYLKRFPVDAVKIDRSFVDGLGVDPGDTAIVSAVIGLAHALGLRVVAEGVETRAQLDELAALGCDRAQGFLFAQPRPAEEMHKLIGRSSGFRVGVWDTVVRRLRLPRRGRHPERRAPSVPAPFTRP
jgi:diguanylate cyclase (GGDEF)-like protein/PAS domain S-box-containing protein